MKEFSIKGYITSTDVTWRYPQVFPPPKGVKMHLLNPGGCSIQGAWSDDMLAWYPLMRRDHRYEDSLLVQETSTETI